MSDITRRDFVAGAAAACACLFCVCEADAARGGGRVPPPSGPIDIGTVKDYPKDGVYDQFARDHRIFVVRKDNRIFAASAICTHEVKRLVASNDRTQIHCREHKAVFSLTGQVLQFKKGEEPKSPLPRYAIKQNADGKLIVDPSKQFAQAKWDDPAAFVTVPA